jgi:hypothetical protein
MLRHCSRKRVMGSETPSPADCEKRDTWAPHAAREQTKRAALGAGATTGRPIRTFGRGSHS